MESPPPPPQRLLPLVVVFFFVAALPAAAHEATSSLHPVVLVPGNTCGQLDARLTDEYEPPTPGCRGGVRKQGQRGWWFRLWENFTALQEDPALWPCYADQLRLVYDPVAADYRNMPGVYTRVVSFGSTRGFRSDDPARKDVCMERLVEALEEEGYTEGENLFGAPYDFRYAPAAPGLPSGVFSDFTSSFRRLVERASERNGGKPVILVTHSLGGLFAMVFLDRSPLPWRRRYVRHFVMLCLGVGGSPLNMWPLAAASIPSSSSSSLVSSVLTYGNRSFASMFSLLPSPAVYGDTPLVITRDKNYSADDMPEFLSAAGFSDDEVALYRTRALPVTLDLRAPLVPMTSINGVGVPTIDKLVFWDGNFSAKPQVVNGDGDGQINLDTVLALERLIGDDPDQGYFKSILIPNTTHKGVISDELALKRVVSEILGANSIN
uniref:Lecithin-cholesterol acyltransferase n=1 Tax=Oryza punctata TaxID=4537 RepID=A0A0E0JTJ4_ORYPU